MPTNINEAARAIIEKTNLKATQNRLKIVACLLDKRQFHTISDILEHTGELNIKSLYNGLKDLVAAGVVEVINDNAGARYELSSVHDYATDVVHLTRNGLIVSHATISDEIFTRLRAEFAKQGKNVKTIKILVEVSNTKH